MRAYIRTRLLLICVCGTLSAAVCAASWTPLLRHDAVSDRCVLLGGDTIGGWETTAATLQSAPLDPQSEACAKFGVCLAWEVGNPAFTRWPRISLALPEAQRNWTPWDVLHLRVFCRSSRTQLPFASLLVSMRSGDGKQDWQRDCENLAVDRWQDLYWDLSALPHRDYVRSISVQLDTHFYQSGDNMDFSIETLELVHYTRPIITDMAPVSPRIFADATAVPLLITLYGAPQHDAVPVDVMLIQGERSLGNQRIMVKNGVTRVDVLLPAHPTPGEYRLLATTGGAETNARFLLVASPWQ